MESRGRSLLRAAALVAAVSVLGRVLGFVRDLVIAHYFGASSLTDAFMVAWTIPETAAPLLQEGAAVWVLVPLFAKELEDQGTLRDSVTRSFLPVVVILLLLASVLALTAPWVAQVLAPGLDDHELADQMVRMAAPTIFFLGLAGYATATLNAQQIFGIPAAVTAAYNLGIIGCILFLTNRLDIYSAAAGLAMGSALTLAVQTPAFLRTVGLPRLNLKIDRSLIYQFAAFIPVGTFVLGRQSQLYVERFLGSFLHSGAISQLNYAARVGQIPLI